MISMSFKIHYNAENKELGVYPDNLKENIRNDKIHITFLQHPNFTMT